MISKKTLGTLLVSAWVCQSFAGYQITMQSAVDAGSHGKGRKGSSTNVVQMVLDEAGPTLLGYPTRHYMFRTSYRVSMNVMGFKNESSVSKDEESWTTTKLNLSVLGAWAGKMPKTSNEDLDQLIQAEKGKMKGIPLKTLSIQTTTDSQGKASVLKSSMEVTEIKKVGADAVSFDVPSDYQEMSLPMSGGNDEDQTKGHSKSKRSSPPKLDFGDLMKKAMEQAQ